MSRERSGLNPLAYLGVEPVTPPQLIVQKRSPQTTDSNYNLGTVWVFSNNNQVWMLTQFLNMEAIWTLLNGGGGGGGVLSVPTNSGIAAPDINGVLRVFGGININTQTSGANTVLVNLNNSILLPPTSADATKGVIALGTVLSTNYFIHNYGTENTFIGDTAGNLTLTVVSSINNSALGSDSLLALTTGNNNTSVGRASQIAVTTGSNNTSVGSNSLSTLTTGASNIVIGSGSGSAYVSTESSNILLASPGVVTENNTIRIGTQGTGAGQQNQAFMAGVYNTAIGTVGSVVQVDSTGKLGSILATNGQVLIGHTGLAPLWGNFVSAGSSVAITVVGNNINLEAVGTGSGAVTFHTDSTDAMVASAAITIHGGTNITTSGATSIVTVALNPSVTLAGTLTLTPLGATPNGVLVNDGTGLISTLEATANGQVLIGKAGSPPVWNTLTAGANVTIDNSVPGAITISSVGGGGGGLVTFNTNTTPATVSGTSITIAGTAPITTSGAGSTVSVALTPATNGQVLIGGGASPVWSTLTAGAGVSIVNAPGSITINNTNALGVAEFQTNSGICIPLGAGIILFLGGANTNTDGLLNIMHVNLNTSIVQPTTNATGSQGLYSLGTALDTFPFLHGYGTNNTFVGPNAGTHKVGSNLFTLTANNLTGIGNSALANVTTGNQNTAVGSNALSSVTSGATNTAVGNGAISGITSGHDNVAIGNNAGNNYTSSESNNVVIHNLGTAGDSNTIKIGTTQTSCQIAGIWNTARSATDRLVFADSTGKLATGNAALGAGVLVSNASGIVSSSSGAAGTILQETASGPVWANVVAGSNVSISNTAGNITINANATPDPSLTCAFSAYLPSNTGNVIGNGSNYTVTGFTTFFDLGGNFNGTIFTAPATGVYYFSINIFTTSGATTTYNVNKFFVGINAAGKFFGNAGDATGISGVSWAFGSESISWAGLPLVHLTAGQTVQMVANMQLLTSPSNTIAIQGGTSPYYSTTFSGYRIA